jgi:hypothetical protein
MSESEALTIIKDIKQKIKEIENDLNYILENQKKIERINQNGSNKKQCKIKNGNY